MKSTKFKLSGRFESEIIKAAARFTRSTLLGAVSTLALAAFAG